MLYCQKEKERCLLVRELNSAVSQSEVLAGRCAIPVTTLTNVLHINRF